MFTGIIEQLGIVRSFELTEAQGAFLEVEHGELFKEVKPGDSVANNGVCLTVLTHDDHSARFELGPETLKKTNLDQLQSGQTLNLELPLRMSDRLGGHFVQGHVDGIGTITAIDQKGDTAWMTIEIPDEFLSYISPKGSIAIDGISLTIASIEQNSIGIMLMSYTLSKTNLSDKKVGDTVNLEFDMLAKLVAHMMANKQ